LLIREAEADILRHAAFVFPMSEFARKSIINDYGCDPQRTIAVGAGANMFSPSLPDTKRYSSRIALFVGTNFEIKGGEVLLEAGNAEALASALASLLGEPERCESMGRAAHSIVLQKHTWDHVVDRMAPSIEAMAAAGPTIAGARA